MQSDFAIFRLPGRKLRSRICYIYLQKADFHWPIHSPEFFLSHETQDHFDFNSCPWSSNHLSKSTLQNELSNICSILINNGYPEAVINTIITEKINQFRRPMHFGPKKSSVYFHLPWLDNDSMRYEMQIKTAVKRCYFAVEPCIVYTTR